VTLKYKLRRLYGEPDEDYDSEYAHEEIESYVEEQLGGVYEGDAVEVEVRKVKIQ